MTAKISSIKIRLIWLFAILSLAFQQDETIEAKFLTYIVNPKKELVIFFYRNDKHLNFSSIKNLKTWLADRHKELIFAMNGGMYKKDQSPQGLFVEKGKMLFPLDTGSGNGNFYLKPNGVFYLTNSNLPRIVGTESFNPNGHIKYATQSGPMLISNGLIHPAFQKGSANLNIRNGVGILPNNNIVFVLSKKEVNFYEFAEYFQSLGCKNALYLDGLVSRAYLPEKKWIQEDGNFGVIIAVTSK